MFLHSGRAACEGFSRVPLTDVLVAAAAVPQEARVQLIRRLDPAVRRLLLACFVMAMLSRALVPAGWMPAAGAGGMRLVPCDGTGPAMAGAHIGTMHHGGHHDAPDRHDGGSHPCTFASVTPGIDAPEIAAPLPPIAARVAFASFRALVSIGHGLAAPPPPQTGPPSSN